MTLQGIRQVLMGSGLVVAMAGSAVAQQHVVGQTGPGAPASTCRKAVAICPSEHVLFFMSPSSG